VLTSLNPVLPDGAAVALRITDPAGAERVLAGRVDQFGLIDEVPALPPGSRYTYTVRALARVPLDRDSAVIVPSPPTELVAVGVSDSRPAPHAEWQEAAWWDLAQDAPATTSSTLVAVRLRWQSPLRALASDLYRGVRGDGGRFTLVVAGLAGEADPASDAWRFEVVDESAEPHVSYVYRVVTVTAAGRSDLDPVEQEVLPLIEAPI
jgi:hypothetical protein